MNKTISDNVTIPDLTYKQDTKRRFAPSIGPMVTIDTKFVIIAKT